MNTELTRAQRASDAVTIFSGSWKFIIGLSALSVAWVWWNRGDRAFDPYPWLMFNSILTVVSTFQSPLIMMSQNRQIERDKQAAEAQAALDRELVQGLHVKLDGLAPRAPHCGECDNTHLIIGNYGESRVACPVCAPMGLLYYRLRKRVDDQWGPRDWAEFETGVLTGRHDVPLAAAE